MQTFLPYPSFSDSAFALDDKRLNKQRVETKQILNALFGRSKGWVHHPATRMWEGCEPLLIEYGIAMTKEWLMRGKNDSMLPWFENQFDTFGVLLPRQTPHWLGDEAFHASHRSNLLRKDPVWYGQYGWKEPPDLPYVWPTPGLAKVAL